jgi:hypothetical protein
MSQGTDFISLLDLPFEVKRRLGPDATADLGEWVVAHRQEVIDALVEAKVLLPSQLCQANHYSVIAQGPA